MWGRATTAMVVSIACMIDAAITLAVISTRLSGFPPATGSSAPAGSVDSAMSECAPLVSGAQSAMRLDVDDGLAQSRRSRVARRPDPAYRPSPWR